MFTIILLIEFQSTRGAPPMPAGPVARQHIHRLPARGQVHQTLAVAIVDQLGDGDDKRPPTSRNLTANVAIATVPAHSKTFVITRRRRREENNSMRTIKG